MSRKHSEFMKRYWQNPKNRQKHSLAYKRVWSTPGYLEQRRKSHPPKLRFLSDGYAFIYKPSHPRAKKDTGYVREHIVILEKKLSRPLQKNEVCHHIDGNKLNNHPSNLEVITRSEHSSHHGRQLGWGYWSYGERNPNAKLSDEKVRSIRSIYSSKKLTSSEIAKKFSITREYAWIVGTKKSWKHIK